MRTEKLLTGLVLGAAFSLGSTFAHAQVQTLTVNAPGSTDARVLINPASTTDPNNNDGLIVPRIDAFPGNASGFNPAPTNANRGLLIYLQQSFTGDANGPSAGYVTGQVYTPGFYYWDGTKWVPFIYSLSTAWVLLGNTGINPATDFLGTRDSNPLVIRTNNIQRAIFRADGSIAMGNSPAIYPSNLMEIDLVNVGSAATDPEQGQGVNILSKALSGANLSIGFRGRHTTGIGGTVGEMRAVNGVANVEGTINATATGGYFNAGLKSTGTLGVGALITGVAADAEASSGATANNTNTFIGGRFGGDATNAAAVRAFGVYSVGGHSTTNNVGVYGGVNATGAQTIGILAAQPAGYSTGIFGYNTGVGDNQVSGFFASANSSANARTVNINLNPAVGTLNGATGFQFPISAEIGAQYNGTENTGNEVADLGAVHGLSSTTSNDVQTIGGLLEGSSSGLFGNYTHAIGGFVLATGNGTTVSPKSKIVGLAASLNFLGNSNVNGIAVNGYAAFNDVTTGRVAAGHFDGTGGGTEFGSISTVGDVTTSYQTFYNTALTGMHIALAATNHYAPASNQLAFYTEGAVRMTGLTGVGTQLLTVDGSGNVGTTAGTMFAAAGPLTFALTAAQSSNDQPIAVTGASVGDVVSLGVPAGAVLPNSSYTAWVSAAGIVTVRFNNYSNGAQTPAAAQTFKVKVMQ